MKGHFIISLDFELHWGVFDLKTVEEYREHLVQVPTIIARLLEMADKYEIKLTFATVGFLFAKDKSELLHFAPKLKPTYTHERFSPYRLMDDIGENEADDPFHFAHSLVRKIKENGKHEIGTHTFCHYYCHELGQTVEQFEADINSAMAIAKAQDISLESIVFPRNMVEPGEPVDDDYLEVCRKHGISSFRGKEKSWFYNIHTTKFYHGWFIFKLIRMWDVYFNLAGANTYDLKKLYRPNKLLNLPSSRLLRPYNKTLSFLEPLKIRRITTGMRHAAKHNEMFHLWWHPHNFGTHVDENFKNLETIFKEYAILHKTYGFQSETMTGVTNQLKREFKQ